MSRTSIELDNKLERLSAPLRAIANTLNPTIGSNRWMISANTGVSLHEHSSTSQISREPNDIDGYMVFPAGWDQLDGLKLIITRIKNQYPDDQVKVLLSPRQEYGQVFDNPLIRWQRGDQIIELMLLTSEAWPTQQSGTKSFRMPVDPEFALQSASPMVIDGQPIPIAHPAFLALYKALIERPVDTIDIQRMQQAGLLASKEYRQTLEALTISPQAYEYFSKRIVRHQYVRLYPDSDTFLSTKGMPIAEEIKQRTVEELHQMTQKRLVEIRKKHPIIDELWNEQRIDHNPEKFPYHSCTNNVDTFGVPTDHIHFVTYYALLFAIASGLSAEEQEIVVIAGAGHDFFQGPGHEQRSADEITNRLRKQGYAQDFIDNVSKAILATSLGVLPNEPWLYQKPGISLPIELCLAEADLHAGGGRDWHTFIKTSLDARLEEIRAKLDSNFTESSMISGQKFKEYFYTLYRIFNVNWKYDIAASALLFPHLAENTRRVGRIYQAMEAWPNEERTFNEWCAQVLLVP